MTVCVLCLLGNVCYASLHHDHQDVPIQQLTRSEHLETSTGPETPVTDLILHVAPLETRTSMKGRETHQRRRNRRRSKRHKPLDSAPVSSTSSSLNNDGEVEHGISIRAPPPTPSPFIINAILLYPPPWLPFQPAPRIPLPTGTETPTTAGAQQQ